MANTKSAIKAARKSARLTIRNRGTQTRLKTLHKKFEQAVAAGDLAVIKAAGSAYASAMDKATKSGVVHRNAASRAKSHVAKHSRPKAAAPAPAAS
ncbi:MAG: 30S ribosomal protein S20 [Opitutaceae bacterium]|jgi:small subunit ribosomal protein S20|nr:30S ribosomal protein S20 [Opitutaceae bacterium]